MSIKRPALVPILAFALLAACGGREAGPSETYRVRGVVRQLPTSDRPGGELHVRHEALPGFRDADGEVVGMESMTMPFPVADPSLLAGIEAGDKIEMEFEVRWDGGHPLAVTAIEELPPATRLSFEEDDSAPGPTSETDKDGPETGS